MNIIKQIVPENKYGIKCPYEMKPTRIVVHNTANDATARNEIVYMTNNNYEISFHFAVDDKEVIQGLPLDRNGWHASDGNGKGNREGIAIEICYSKSGGDRFIKAEQNAVELIVYLLRKYNWGIDKVTKHQDYTNKYCPHRTLDLGWERFINMIKDKLDVPQEKPKKINVKYQVYAGGKWWGDIVNYNNIDSNGYAGVYGKPISGFRGNTVGTLAEAGNLIYRVHTKGGKWLGEIVDRQKDKWGDDFAGILNQSIDGIAIKSTKGTAKYRVHIKGGKWLEWVTQYNINDSVNGMAGIYGKEIDAIQVEII
jgi:hypothetical protein